MSGGPGRPRPRRHPSASATAAAPSRHPRRAPRPCGPSSRSQSGLSSTWPIASPTRRLDDPGLGPVVEPAPDPGAPQPLPVVRQHQLVDRFPVADDLDALDVLPAVEPGEAGRPTRRVAAPRRPHGDPHPLVQRVEPAPGDVDAPPPASPVRPRPAAGSGPGSPSARSSPARPPGRRPGPWTAARPRPRRVPRPTYSACPPRPRERPHLAASSLAIPSSCPIPGGDARRDATTSARRLPAGRRSRVMIDP